MDKAKELVLHGTNGSRPDFGDGSIFFVGTATVIIRYAGFTILTDPNFLHSGDHVHLGYGMTSKRRTDPAIDIDQLPPLDLCVLSHMHGDHFDRIAETRLDKNLPIISTRHAAASLKSKGFKAPHGLEMWETFTVKKGDARLRITSMPGKHAPGLLQLALPPVMGSMLEFQTAEGETTLRLYITGDTLVHEHLREIPRRYPSIDIALLHLGGTRILGVMLTMDARQGVEAIKIIKPRTAIPIHYNDYTVFKSPLRDFQKAVVRAGLEKRIVYLSHGQTYKFEVPASRWQQDRKLNREGIRSTQPTDQESVRESERNRIGAQYGVGRVQIGQSSTAVGAASVDRARDAFEGANLGSARIDFNQNALGGRLNESGLDHEDFDSDNGQQSSRIRKGGGSGRRDGGSLSTGLVILGGAGLGAALMYMLDSDKGRRRRALVRARLASASNKAGNVIGKRSRDLSNRTQGATAKAGMTPGSRGNGQEQLSGAPDQSTKEAGAASQGPVNTRDNTFDTGGS